MAKCKDIYPHGRDFHQISVIPFSFSNWVILLCSSLNFNLGMLKPTKYYSSQLPLMLDETIWPCLGNFCGGSDGETSRLVPKGAGSSLSLLLFMWPGKAQFLKPPSKAVGWSHIWICEDTNCHGLCSMQALTTQQKIPEFLKLEKVKTFLSSKARFYLKFIRIDVLWNLVSTM